MISPVKHSEWATPTIVVVKKKNGQIRLCADFSTGLNNALHLHQYPLPTTEDVFTKLNGGQLFTQIEFAEAYLQVEVEEEFQQIMDSMNCGLEGVAAYLDDVIDTDRTYEEHRRDLEALFGRIHEYGFPVRMERCNFSMPQIRYLGCIIDKNERHRNPEKIGVIRQMSVPKNVAEWIEECEAAFTRAKEVLASDLLLTHFDPSLEIIVAADASDYGIGADGTEKAICHASRSLTAAEKNYRQIEKEVLALIFAVRKFHRFKLLTDHKLLLHIFGPKKMAPMYTKTTEFGQANFLSLLIPPRTAQAEDIVIAKTEQDIIAVQAAAVNALPVTRSAIVEN
ncbi:hypothetical protein ANCDUO_00151 [Ancylostoma duodenale]|uniref:Reverse transcriptase/retrotransposon-derived protein RNase H-like domain-containing protein n=1 Tax=Ancylostoma duodenale TaxID=51022 RepID=A0A0C2HCR9_9BILA|nr:hypothetical protein ANCDUO_00151 [Ancylostoma duodenale]